MALDIRDRCVLVTGASSGIGEATARALALAGARVVLVSERAAELNAVVRSIAQGGGQAFPLVADFSKPAQVDGLVCQAEELAGPVDVLINNAGVGMNLPVMNMRMEDMRFLFEINYFALTSLCQQALREMAPRGEGRIINVTSAAGQFGCANFSAYSATKGAVHVYTQALRIEAQSQGVHVSEVVPISVRTPFFDNAKGKSYRPTGVVLTVEAVARSIVRCVADRRPRPEVLPYRGVRAVFVLNALLPDAMGWLYKRTYARKMRQADPPQESEATL